MKKAIISFSIALIYLVVALTNVVAEDKYWIGGTGDWNDPLMWNPSDEPQSGDNVYLIEQGANDTTVYQTEGFSGLVSLQIDASGMGSMTFSFSQDSDTASFDSYDPDANVLIGFNGTTTVNQPDGLLDIHYQPIYIGTSGTYNLYGGSLWASGTGYIDIAGTFNQTGGELQFSTLMDVSGTYNMQGGNILSNSHLLSVSEGGVFNQSGGVVNGGEAVWVGGEKYNGEITGGGTYNLSGGELNVGGANLKISDKGVFNQTGGKLALYGSSYSEASASGFNGLQIGSSLGDDSTFNLSGGTLQVGSSSSRNGGDIVNNGTFNYSGGELIMRKRLSPESGDEIIKGTLTNNGTTSLSGSGTRTVDGDVVNNGTFKTTHTTAVYKGTFTNNGAYISDPATQFFEDLVIGETGYLVGQRFDDFYISGDFINYSTMKYDWDTKQSYLGFIEGEDNMHDFFLTGVDYGDRMSGVADNFSWGTLDIAGNIISLYDGNEEDGAALYLRLLIGAEILGDTIMNIIGDDGFTIYYNPHLKENWYLAGLDYNLTNGGFLRPTVPEPATVLLFGIGLLGLAVASRKKWKYRSR